MTEAVTACQEWKRCDDGGFARCDGIVRGGVCERPSWHAAISSDTRKYLNLVKSGVSRQEARQRVGIDPRDG